MKLKISTIYACIITLVLSLAIVNDVHAGTISDITFEQQPLFNEADILPGHSVTRWIKVASKYDNNLAVNVVATNISDPDRLGDMLKITIRKGANIIYQNTLSVFFDASVINLDTLQAYDDAQYDFTVDFLKTTGNDYQDKSLMFDISLTATDEIAAGSDTSDPGSYAFYSSSGNYAGGAPLSGSDSGPTIVLGEAAQPILAVSKTVDRASANPGDTGISYRVAITNNGNLAAYGVTLDDVLPPGLRFADNSGQHKTILAGDIEPGAFKTYNYLVNVAPDIKAGDYINTVTVSASNHNDITAAASLSIDQVQVLGLSMIETGFSNSEFALLLLILAAVIITIIYLKRKLKNNNH